MGILVRSKQSSAEGGKKETSSVRYGHQTTSGWAPTGTTGAVLYQAQGKGCGWGAWMSMVISLGKGVPCPPLPGQTEECLSLWHYPSRVGGEQGAPARPQPNSVKPDGRDHLLHMAVVIRKDAADIISVVFFLNGISLVSHQINTTLSPPLIPGSTAREGN